eukprot:CAMPEP_0196130660 /NCGR_PEP_ID=MMETSP0910-20130528/958_1 /TAXON_ID=49265 /ORGANISM="Thalassiosira rotula, Strain GSO102" /LENGTH=283 /DNA_ID=CAMNT_0041390009 /DNA_START=64 /DNA_END=912 /DNA_ORIENTATION=+
MLSPRSTLVPVTIAALTLLLSPSTNAFVPPSSATTKTSSAKTKSTTSSSSSTTSLPAFPPEFLDSILHPTTAASTDEIILTSADYARQKFWFYFFAGSGAGGIGIAQLPTMFSDAAAARATAELSGSTTRGGATLDAGPLVGIYYDAEISMEDVADAIAKAPSAEFISSRSESLNYMASRGYIERGDFAKEMEVKGCNALASCVVYDAISQGKGGVVSPVVYEDKLEAYRSGIGNGVGGDVVASSFVGDLNGFLAVKVGAFFGLVFCLFIDFAFIANAGIEGW